MTRVRTRRTFLLVGLLAVAALPACGGGVADLILPNNHALWFDGWDDFVQIPDSGHFDFAFAFTLEAWVRPDALISTPWYAGIVGAPASYFIALDGNLGGSDQTAWFGRACTPGCSDSVTATGALQLNTWQHLAIVYDGVQLLLYRDGLLETGILKSGNVTNVSALWIGFWEVAFHGVIDEVRVWNVARSQASIQGAMNTALTGGEPGLVGYWRFDEGQGQQVYDATGGGSTGQLGSSGGADADDPSWLVSDAPVF